MKSIKIHNRILQLTENYDQLNLVNDSLLHDQKLKNKLELRDIKLSTILLRMKAHKKLLNYSDAFIDAKKLWSLMSPSERVNNSHFKEQYLNELKILSEHCQNSQQVINPKKEESKIDTDFLKEK